MSKPYEITTDDRNVWINMATACLARMSNGIAQIFPTPETSETFIPGDWNRWIERVKEVHGIEVPEDVRPRWSR